MTTAIQSVAQPIKLTTTKEINGAWTASMSIRPDDYIAAETYVDIDGEEYIARNVKKINSAGKIYYDVALQHNLYELLDLTIDRFYLTKSVDDLLDYILTGSGWTKGTCDIDDEVLVNTDRRTTVLEALNLLATRSGGELYFHSKTKTVDLVHEIGSVTGHQLRIDKNCNYIEKEEDSTDLVTRIYPYGPDNYTINTTIVDDCEDETDYTPSGGASVEASNIKQNGSQGIKIIAAALNETFIRDLAANTIDLSDHDTVKFWIYSETANASGFTFGIGEAAYTDNTVNTGALVANCWHEIELDISAVANASKNAIRYIGFKNLTNGAAEAVVDCIRAFSGEVYIDSANKSLYEINKEYVYQHSAKFEKLQHQSIVYPTDDARVFEAAPNTNYGTGTVLETRHWTTYSYRSFLKFTASLPTGATLVSATLYMYVSAINSEGSGTTSDVYLVDADWDENIITWNNQPAATTDLGNVDLTTTGWKTFDLTDEYQDWVDGLTSNYGVRLGADDQAENEHKSQWINSKENIENRVYLEVIYTTDIDPAPVIEEAAREYLAEHDEPKLLYKVKAVDLPNVLTTTWTGEDINLGDTLRLYDSDLGLNVNVRVKKITKDLLHPENLTLELANKAYSLTDIQAKIAKQLKYIMPFEDDDRIGYANTIQKGYLGGDVNV